MHDYTIIYYGLIGIMAAYVGEIRLCISGLSLPARIFVKILKKVLHKYIGL
jgi:hypothetical protein